MAFTPETAKKAGSVSSRKGVPNKATATIRTQISSIINDNTQKYIDELGKLEGKDFVQAFHSLLEYSLPKLQRVETNQQPDLTQVILNLGNGIKPTEE